MIAHKLIAALFPFQLIFLLNPLAYSEGTPQNKKKKNESRVVIVEGKINNGSTDTVTLFFQKEFIYNYIGRENSKAACDSNGYFKLTLAINHPAKISLFLNGDTKVLFNNFYIVPGDTISATITKGEKENIVFSGNGSEKFTCMYALDICRKNLLQHPPAQPQFIKDAGDSVINEIRRSFKSLDLYGSYFFNILSMYKQKMKPEIFKLLQADIKGDMNLSKCFIFLESIKHVSSKQKKAIARCFQSFYEPKEKSNDSMVVYSEDYIEFLLRCLQIKFNLSSENRKYSMKEMVMLIEKDYQGLIRDRILTNYLLSPKIGISNVDYEYCLKRSLHIMNSPLYKQYIKAQLEKFSKGSFAYNFSLPDSGGAYISLSDFKGKVVLIDFWFTGCSACIGLSKDLVKNVIPNFKDSLVVFISISLDKEKGRWIKSVNSGLYTSRHSINLFTEGLGFAHPLVTNYNIQGCPALLLIDGEGKIVSASPQWDPEKLCAEILSAIKKNSRPD